MVLTGSLSTCRGCAVSSFRRPIRSRSFPLLLAAQDGHLLRASLQLKWMDVGVVKCLRETNLGCTAFAVSTTHAQKSRSLVRVTLDSPCPWVYSFFFSEKRRYLPHFTTRVYWILCKQWWRNLTVEALCKNMTPSWKLLQGLWRK